MGLKKFISFGLMLLVVMGIVVYSFVGDVYSFSVFGIPIELPIAIWVLLPALLMYVFTILHLMFYGTLGFAKMRKVKNDGETLLQNSKNALLGKIVETEYKTDIFKLPGAVLPLLNVDPKRYADHRVYDDGIQDILDIKRKIDEGEVVDLAPFSLKEDNALVIKNYENKIAIDRNYAQVVLRSSKDKGLCEKAHLALASFSSLDEINKYDIKPTRELFNVLIDRVSAKENSLELPDEAIVTYAKELDFRSKDFIELAKKLKTKLNPDRLMLLFERLAHEFPSEAGEAYLYVMFELQMMDNAREFLENTSEDEYIKFKYLLFLKDSGKIFDTELFI
jgi:hypothetical protein